jgi:hypothetical protein
MPTRNRTLELCSSKNTSMMRRLACSGSSCEYRQRNQERASREIGSPQPCSSCQTHATFSVLPPTKEHRNRFERSAARTNLQMSVQTWQLLGDKYLEGALQRRSEYSVKVAARTSRVPDPAESQSSLSCSNLAGNPLQCEQAPTTPHN